MAAEQFNQYIPPVPAPLDQKPGIAKVLPTKLLIVAVFLLLFLATIVFAFKSLLPVFKKTPSGGNIVWWGLWEDEGDMSSLINEYQTKNPKVKIKYVRQSKEDYRDRLTSALASGSGPDIFRIHNTWVPMFKNELEPIPANIFSPAQYSQIFYPVATNDFSLGTSLVALPLEFDGLALFINEDIFEKGAKTPPKNWDELRKTAIALTVKDDKGIIQRAGVALGRTENIDHWPEILGLMMLQNGVKLSNPRGKLAEDALSYFTIFSAIDRVWDSSLPPSTLLFSSGKLAMYFGPSWRIHEIKAQNPKLKFTVVPVPQLPKDETSETNINYATYWAEAVSSRSKVKLEAWKFLQFLSSKESLQKLYFNASRTRLFGEPYPRVDMAGLLASDPLTGSFITGASSAQSWYLASMTWDGATGINSRINKYFEDAINAVNSGRSVTEVTETVANGVNQVLSSYGLIRNSTK